MSKNTQLFTEEQLDFVREMINKVAGNTITLMNFLIVVLGLGVFGMAFGIPITSFVFWLGIVIGALLLFIAWALWRVLYDFERLENRYLSTLQQLGYRDLDDYTKRQKLNQILDTEKEIDKGSLLEAVSTDDLLALRTKYQNNPSVVKLIDSVLEARSE